MQHLQIDHVTEYVFDAPRVLLPHRLRIRPRENHNVRILSSRLDVSPRATVRWQRDALDNSVAVLTFGGGTNRLRVQSSVVIAHYHEAPLDFVVEDYAVSWPFNYPDTDAALLSPFLVPTWPADAEPLRDWLAADGLSTQPVECFTLLDGINRNIHRSFTYQGREEEGVQAPGETLRLRRGSCRDFAALFMDTVRHLGLAARFVSGYLHTPELAAVDPGATHAWAEVYIPGPSWVGFDPTVGTLTGLDHIAIAVAGHPEHVPPVAGSFIANPGHVTTMQVDVRVTEVARGQEAIR